MARTQVKQDNALHFHIDCSNKDCEVDIECDDYRSFKSMLALYLLEEYFDHENAAGRILEH